MDMPDKLRERLAALGLDERIYAERTRKCILSREKTDMERVPWYEHAYFVPEDLGRSETSSRSSEKQSFSEIPKSFGFRESQKVLLSADFPKANRFIFDPVSLVPCLALEAGKEKILDMCAAPGTKTFILSFLTDNEAHIVANDIDKYRVRRLRANVYKFNLSCEVLNISGRKLTGIYDKILLDAPCSGEGMINKKEKMFLNWSEKKVRLLAKKQRKIVEHAFELLSPGGTLVYSTCTFEPEENEMIIAKLMERFGDAKIEKAEISGIRHAAGLASWNGKEFPAGMQNCLRIYPQHNKTGGFFVAKIRKAI